MGLYEMIKDVAKIAKKANNIGLYRQLIDLSSQALDLQDEINKLKEENEALKKNKDLDEKIIRHSQPYITLSDDKKDIKYCAICWGNEQKLIQMKGPMDANSKYYCQKCHNKCRKD